MKTTTPVILILVSAGLFYTFISPHYEKVQALQGEANEYSEVLDNVEELTEKRDELLIKFNAIPKADVVRVEKALPDNIDSVRLALDFDTIAAKYGISIKNINLSERQGGGDQGIIQAGNVNQYETATVTFSFVATYPNFRKFIRDIESSLRIIDIRSIGFITGESGFYEYTVSIDTYWLK
ncbi:MAG: hypothetical protein M3Q24_01785 [bacterium]|nr:hypothetical protein [bacterium]